MLSGWVAPGGRLTGLGCAPQFVCRTRVVRCGWVSGLGCSSRLACHPGLALRRSRGLGRVFTRIELEASPLQYSSL